MTSPTAASPAATVAWALLSLGIACITQTALLDKILAHLGIPPARRQCRHRRESRPR